MNARSAARKRRRGESPETSGDEGRDRASSRAPSTSRGGHLYELLQRRVAGARCRGSRRCRARGPAPGCVLRGRSPDRADQVTRPGPRRVDRYRWSCGRSGSPAVPTCRTRCGSASCASRLHHAVGAAWSRACEARQQGRLPGADGSDDHSAVGRSQPRRACGQSRTTEERARQPRHRELVTVDLRRTRMLALPLRVSSYRSLLPSPILPASPVREAASNGNRVGITGKG